MTPLTVGDVLREGDRVIVLDCPKARNGLAGQAGTVDMLSEPSPRARTPARKRWQYRVVLDWGRQLYCAERPPGGPAGAATRMVPASLQRTVWFFADELRKARP